MRQFTLGVDSGTQSTKVVVCATDGTVVASANAPHPDGCVQHPSAWWSALVAACQQLPREIRDGVAAVAVGGQQHGCVPLDDRRDVTGPAALWCDMAAAPEAARLNQLAGFASEVGSRLVASFTIAKLAAVPAGTTGVCLPHDWLTLRLTGNLVTDRGDASGTGWWDPRQGIRRDLLHLANRPELAVPEPIGPDDAAGELQPEPAAALGLPPGIAVGCGTGDNMAAALGIGARESEVVISLGTSGTVFAVSSRWTQDDSGAVAGFADATGRFLPLVCTLNCTTPVERVAGWMGLALADALDRADRATEVTFLPYLKGERTPDLPAATGALVGITERTEPEDLLAAAVQGAAMGLSWGWRPWAPPACRPPTLLSSSAGGLATRPGCARSPMPSTGPPPRSRAGTTPLAGWPRRPERCSRVPRPVTWPTRGGRRGRRRSSPGPSVFKWAVTRNSSAPWRPSGRTDRGPPDPMANMT